jgi:hypothetical protein
VAASLPPSANADIADTAQIPIVVDRESQPDIEAVLKRAKEARRQIIYLGETAKAYAPSALRAQRYP